MTRQSTQHGTFIWRDLSAYDAPAMRDFYAQALGWHVARPQDGYAVAAHQGAEVAGIFSMPDKFQAMGMPSFWMGYIAVDDVDATVALAEAEGGKVEVRPTEYPSGGRFALIRDPLGAGFTVFEAAPFGAPSGSAHALFVSDAKAVTRFYSALFGWRFETLADGVLGIDSASGQRISHLYEVPDPAVRGKEQYWAVTFDGDPAQAQAAGARIEAQMPLVDGSASLMRDPGGAAFLLRTAAGDTNPQVKGKEPGLSLWAWFGFALLWGMVLLNQTWPWAVFLGAWTYVGLRDRATYLFQMVTRADHPVLYWLLMASYAALAVLALLPGGTL